MGRTAWFCLVLSVVPLGCTDSSAGDSNDRDGGSGSGGGANVGGAGGTATGGTAGIASTGGAAGGSAACTPVEQGAVGYLPIVPAHRGFGMDTVAGSGRGTGSTQVMRVKSLDSAGPDTLRACLEAEGPRVCVFEISGTIEATADFEIRNPYITVAGQTAPSPGITLKNATFLVLNTHDVLVQHIRVRVGDDPGGSDPENRDGIAVGAFPPTDAAFNIVFDHVSVSWAVDETMSTWADTGSVHDVAIVDSIFGEALRCSIHPEGCHSAGLIVGANSTRVMTLRSLYAHNDWRNPLVRESFDDLLIANNVVFADGDEGVGIADNEGAMGPSTGDVIGNVLRLKEASLGSTALGFTSGSSFFFADNLCDSGSGPCVFTQGGADQHLASTATLAIPGLALVPTANVEPWVLSHVGARPNDRDEVDERIVSDVTAGTTRMVNSPSEVGGWPVLEENVQEYTDPPDGDSVPDTDPYTGSANPGYTARELYLHELARKLECP